jgi:hypothetical protein
MYSPSLYRMDQVWDHQIASSKGCLDFLERDCPKQKLEVAIDMLSKNGYRHAGLLNKLQKLPPNDGSDWSQDERHKFHLLFDQFGHNLKKVARAMGKSVISCTLFHFGQGQKRQTRRSRTSSAIQQKSSKSIPPTETATIQQKPTKSIHTLDEPPETDEKDCKWNFYISELKKFKKEFGHTLVPKVFPQNQPLSSWVYKVRGYVFHLQFSLLYLVTNDFTRFIYLIFQGTIGNFKSRIRNLRRTLRMIKSKSCKMWDFRLQQRALKSRLWLKTTRGYCVRSQIGSSTIRFSVNSRISMAIPSFQSATVKMQP